MRLSLVLSWLLLFAIHLLDAQTVPIPPSSSKQPALQLDSFLQSMIDCSASPTNIPPLNNPYLVRKGVAVQLAPAAAVCFDTEKLEYAAGWTGGFLNLDRTSLTGSAQGSIPPRISGKISFRSSARASTNSPPGTNSQFLGFYRYDGKVIFSYRIGDATFLDLPEAILEGDRTIFTHVVQKGNETPVRLALGQGIPSKAPVPSDLHPWTHGGPPRWPTNLVTTGKKGPDDAAYTVDRITVPENNPWHSWMRLTGLDFFSDGRCAVSTLSGDVWLVSGLDDSLSRVTWKRFATGLFEPLGLKIVQDQVYVLGRDRLSILRDLNHDDEADFYQSFNSGWDVYPTYHAFNMDLQADSAGNFYFIADGNMVDPDLSMHGAMLKVSADGQRCEVFCSGMRAANGMGIGPRDEITCADNQGHWTPSSRINWVKRGGFYGYGGDPRMTNVNHPIKRPIPTTFDPPLCWLPMTADNSSGGQVWSSPTRWGPLGDRLFHTSYGKCSLFLVLPEQIGETWQAGAVQLPLRFQSGIMRGRVNPRDGQLYLCGLKGWQTSATLDGALERVRYTGLPLRIPIDFHVSERNIAITFSCELDRASATDPGNFGIEQWNYLWSKEYGSADYKPGKPGVKGRETIEISRVETDASGRRLLLTTQPLKPVMQMQIRYNLRSADGIQLQQEIYNTINQLPQFPGAQKSN